MGSPKVEHDWSDQTWLLLNEEGMGKGLSVYPFLLPKPTLFKKINFWFENLFWFITFVENLSKRHYYLLNSYAGLTLLTPEFFKVIIRNHLWFISIPNIHFYSERLYCLRAGTVSWTLPEPNFWQVINVNWMKGLLVQCLAQSGCSGFQKYILNNEQIKWRVPTSPCILSSLYFYP